MNLSSESFKQHAANQQQQRQSSKGKWCSSVLVFALGFFFKSLLSLDLSVSSGLAYQPSSSCSVSNPITTATTTNPITTATTTNKARSFTEIVKESGSDKFSSHHYEQYYENWLQPFRSKPNITFLEIGVFSGQSLAIWNEYFDNHPMILGLAYGMGTQNLAQKVQSMNQISIQFGDQSNSETMASLRQQGPWDIIVDDGSHVPKHMIYTLFNLWNSVKPGGMYIIEDLETNYWPNASEMYGYVLTGSGVGVSPEFSAVSKIEQIQQVLVRYQIGHHELSVMPGDGDICSVEWGMNLVALKKCPLDVVKPLYKDLMYDIQHMTDWIAQAKQTNP